MFHRRIREERNARGLTQQRLSKLAGIPRSQLQKLEGGENVTLSTIQKTIEQLHGLRLEIVPEGLDVAELQSAAAEVHRLLAELFAASGRLLRATGADVTTAPPPAPTPGGGGATRHEPTPDPALLDRLEAELDEAQRAAKRDKRH